MRGYGNKTQYIHLKKRDGKEWYFNCDDLEHGLVLYQPSKPSGKMIKKYLHLGEKLKLTKFFSCKLLGIDMYMPPECKAAEQAVASAFCNKHTVYLSYFLGTPCAHQKETIQISDGSEILGYCKVTNAKEIYEIFLSESKLLGYLEGRGVTRIPKCLYCGMIDGTGVFLQDTHKTLFSKQISDITPQLKSFMEELYAKTSVECQYCQSDICISIGALKNNLLILQKIVSPQDYATIVSAIESVENELSKMRIFYAAHRDFTPWNMYYEKDQIEVFDFEYAKKTYPKEIDYIHFIVQSMVYETGATVEKIIEKIENNKDFLTTDYKFTAICYILDFISLYIEREGKNISINLIDDIQLRIKILQHFYTD